MKLYAVTQSLPWPRTYVGRILLICFVGTHVPLLVLVAVALTASIEPVPLSVLAVVLAATLAGTALTIWAVNAMLKPVTRSVDALNAYASRRERPLLPTGYRDEAGQLMASVQATLDHVDTRFDTMSRIASTDPLTGAFNRRWMNEAGIPSFERLRRARHAISLLVIDLDDFKAINDALGHGFGDRALGAVASAIRTTLREDDQLVRVGGDEFCVFLPGADAATSAGIAEAIRQEVTRSTAKLQASRVMTVSIGAATASLGDRSFTDVYRRADRHLYAVKHGGRDGVSTDHTGRLT